MENRRIMKKTINITVAIIIIITFIRCKNETTQVTENIDHKESLVKKSYTFSKPLRLIQSEDFIEKLFANELSKFYGKKYSCEPSPDATVYGDINGDGKIDIITRYVVYFHEEQTWYGAGWLIAFSNDIGELENFYFIDWSSDKGSRNTLDLGFPVSIENGSIIAKKDEYREEDASCCPSFETKISYTFDDKLQLLDGYIVDKKRK
jgi:hypothetical protein